VAGRRNAIASALVECPVGRWVTVNEFFHIRAAGHDFEVTRDLWNLYISEAHYGSLDQVAMTGFFGAVYLMPSV